MRVLQVATDVGDDGGIGMLALGQVAADREAMVLELLSTMKGLGGALGRDGTVLDDGVMARELDVRRRAVSSMFPRTMFCM